MTLARPAEEGQGTLLRGGDGAEGARQLRPEDFTPAPRSVAAQRL